MHSTNQEVKMTERSIASVFCDDIRHEEGGKISLIGVYTADMLVSQLPITLPKLCIWTNVMTVGAAPFEKLTIRLVQEGRDAPLLESGDVAAEAAAWKEASRKGVEMFTIGVEFVISPFQIDTATHLQVVAECEDGLLKGRRLAIGMRKSDIAVQH